MNPCLRGLAQFYQKLQFCLPLTCAKNLLNNANTKLLNREYEKYQTREARTSTRACGTRLH